MNLDSSNQGFQIEYFPRAQIVHEPLFIDGYTRTGKFLLGSLLDSLEKTEYFQNSVFLETSLYLAKLGKIDFQTLKILIQTDLDFNSYNMAIGRNLNSRKSDESSILHSINAKELLSRANTTDQNLLFQNFQKLNLLPLYITHEALCNVGVLFEIYPYMKLISTQRNPISLIMSWRDRGWGHRWGNDPQSFSIAFNQKGKAIPWFAIDWAEEYWNLSEIERIVQGLHHLSILAKKEYENLNSDNKSRILFVEFDKLLTSPLGELDRVANFLGRKLLPGIESTMKRQRVPREINLVKLERFQDEILAVSSSAIRNLFYELVNEYKIFWLPLAQASDN